MIWNIVYFLIVPFGAWLAGLRAAFWYHNHPPANEGVDLFDIFFGAMGVCIYLLVIFVIMWGFLTLMHINYATMLHDALCPVCSVPTVAPPQ